MPADRVWDETIPSGISDLSLGSDRIRDFKQDVRQRMSASASPEHFWNVNQTVDGKHQKSAARLNYGASTGSAGTPPFRPTLPDGVTYYAPDTTTGSDKGAFFLTTDTGVIWYVDATNTWVDSGLRAAFRSFYFILPGTLAGGQAAQFHLVSPLAGTFARVVMTVDTAPTIAGGAVVDILRGPLLANNFNETSIFPTVTRPTIAINNRAVIFTAFESSGPPPNPNSILAKNDVLYIKVVAGGGAANLALTLDVLQNLASG